MAAGKEEGETMTPYGYRIIDGEALIDGEAAMILRMMFSLYLKGYTIADARHDSGFPQSITAAAFALSNPVYTGTEFYPRLISQETYDQVQEERKSRKRRPKGTDSRKHLPVTVKTQFRLGLLETGHVCGNPSPQEIATTIYRQIESHMPGMSEEPFSDRANEQTENQIRGFFRTLSSQ